MSIESMSTLDVVDSSCWPKSSNSTMLSHLWASVADFGETILSMFKNKSLVLRSLVYLPGKPPGLLNSTLFDRTIVVLTLKFWL